MNIVLLKYSAADLLILLVPFVKMAETCEINEFVCITVAVAAAVAARCAGQAIHDAQVASERLRKQRNPKTVSFADETTAVPAVRICTCTCMCAAQLRCACPCTCGGRCNCLSEHVCTCALDVHCTCPCSCPAPTVCTCTCDEREHEDYVATRHAPKPRNSSAESTYIMIPKRPPVSFYPALFFGVPPPPVREPLPTALHEAIFKFWKRNLKVVQPAAPAQTPLSSGPFRRTDSGRPRHMGC